MPRIVSVETLLVDVPTRREHKWAGLTEKIGRYLLVKLTDDDGRTGWGEAPALKDWGGEFGRYFGESTAIVRTVITSYLAPAVKGVEVGDIIETFIYRTGIQKARFDFTTAAGLFNGLMGMVLVLAADRLAKKMDLPGIF